MSSGSSNLDDADDAVRHVYPDVMPRPLDVVLRGISNNNSNDDLSSSTSSAEELLQCPSLKWGILGCGRVSHDWCLALRHLPTPQQLVACATASTSATASPTSTPDSSSTSSNDRAQQFAQLYNVSRYYHSYEELCQDPDVQIVYVGTIHSTRRQVVELCLRHDKHVLVEKPFAMNYQDATYLIELARQKPHLLVTEGMWTRFFPAVQHARNLIQQGTIGHVCTVMTDFNINAGDHEHYPTSFFYQPHLGGGATMLVGPYPVAAALLAFDGRPPVEIKAVGQVDPNTSVDLHATLVMRFEPPPTTTAPSSNQDDGGITAEDPSALSPIVPGAGTATLTYGILCESEEVTTVIGTKGRITIMSPSHNPTSVKLEIKGHGRGNVADIPTIYHYPLPEDTPEIKAAGGFFYPNSAGFCYEAAAVARCVADLEQRNHENDKDGSSGGNGGAPQYPLDETLLTMKILDEVRAQIGA